MNTPPILMPHAVCWAAAPHLIWTMVVANLVTFLSYVTLCGALLLIAGRTFRKMARDWVWFLVGFALFIVACGSTHLMEVITTWIPVFWIDAWTTIFTAVLSAYVAIMLIRRAGHISFAINDYADRLASTEQEKGDMRDELLAGRKLENWSKMSAVISHEIRNPLDAIQNILYLVQTDPTASGAISELAEQAQQEVARVITISRSMLSFHRESAMPELVNLRSVAESVRFLLQGLIQERGIEFKIVGEDACEIEALPGETRQIMLNLARNACEATTRPGCTVTLEFACVSDGVEFQVTDQGCGIDPQIQTALFEFGKSTKGENGNGMGLWAVKQILTTHGGQIALDTEYRRGARFIVWWPKLFCAGPMTEPGTTSHIFQDQTGLRPVGVASENGQ